MRTDKRERGSVMTERWRVALVAGVLSGVVAVGALGAASKSSLIGNLEGPEVVTDPAKFPKTFKEAPQLAELVKAGKLPPVAERIGQDPLVIKPLHESGRYGRPRGAGRPGAARVSDGLSGC